MCPDQSARRQRGLFSTLSNCYTVKSYSLYVFPVRAKQIEHESMTEKRKNIMTEGYHITQNSRKDILFLHKHHMLNLGITFHHHKNYMLNLGITFLESHAEPKVNFFNITGCVVN